MRVGIFGGSFDPIHNGHLFVAETVLREFDLDRILFIPAFVNPFKQGQEKSVEDKHRYEMTKMAVASHPKFQTEDFELRKKGPSYTIETLKHFSAQLVDCTWFLIMGGDSFSGFPRWKSALEITELASIIVYDRKGSAAPKDFDFGDKLLTCELDIPIEISSTMIRQRIQRGQSFRYLVPEIVFRYIDFHGLYKS